MTRSIAIFLVLLSTLGISSQSSQATDLIPPTVAAQLGMTEAWRRQLQVPAGSQSIADQQIHIHADNPREYVEVTVPVPEDVLKANPGMPATKVMTRIPIDRIGEDGLPIGKKEAERLANHDIRRLKRRGYAAEMTTSIVPRIHLYTLGNDGTLECRDAETGEPIWMSICGRRGLNFGAMGISEKFISVINGANLIQVDISNGEVMEEVRMSGTPLYGAVHAARYAMVATIRNGVEGYPMYDPTLDPFHEMVSGHALSLPTRAPKSARVAWGTSGGYVYVLEMAGEPSMLFRLDTAGIVSGRVAAATGDRFFFGSESGQVYGIRATRSGKVLWSNPFGEPFYNGPVVVGEQVLLRSAYGNLFSLSVDSGISTWDNPSPSIDEFVGAIGDQLFVRTLGGNLAVLDLKTGKQTKSYSEIRPGKILANFQTDRLYLVGAGGAVQCLRPEGSEMPSFREQPDIEPKEEAAAAAPAPLEPAKGADPFGAGGDPFGAGGDPFGAGGGGADPFGGDPFGGGGGDAMADPFGGDPFGGN